MSEEEMLNLSVAAPDNMIRPRICVIGVGGAGGNALNNMIRANLEGCEFVGANTDTQALSMSLAPRKLQLGVALSRGLGAGSKPEVGRAAAEEQTTEIMGCLEGTDMLFITAGMGGGTGTGAAPVIARIARDAGILTVGVVTKPFHFEGTNRMRQAESGLAELQQYVDTLIVIPNQNLFRIANERTTFAEAFRMADEVLHAGVRGITDLMVMPGFMNLDFADVKTVMEEMGKAMMGTGEAEGEGRAIRAAEAAISNPLLDDISMRGARGVLINITGGLDMTLFEVDQAATRIREEVDPEAQIKVGSTLGDDLTGKIRVSVIATGIEAPIHEKASSNRRGTGEADKATSSTGGGAGLYAPSTSTNRAATGSVAAGGSAKEAAGVSGVSSSPSPSSASVGAGRFSASGGTSAAVSPVSSFSAGHDSAASGGIASSSRGTSSGPSLLSQETPSTVRGGDDLRGRVAVPSSGGASLASSSYFTMPSVARPSASPFSYTNGILAVPLSALPSSGGGEATEPAPPVAPSRQAAAPASSPFGTGRGGSAGIAPATASVPPARTPFTTSDRDSQFLSPLSGGGDRRGTSSFGSSSGGSSLGGGTSSLGARSVGGGAVVTGAAGAHRSHSLFQRITGFGLVRTSAHDSLEAGEEDRGPDSGASSGYGDRPVRRTGSEGPERSAPAGSGSEAPDVLEIPAFLRRQTNH